MVAKYLVNIAGIQRYFDATLTACRAPGSAVGEEPQTLHFVSVQETEALLSKEWDAGLAEFTAGQRSAAKLYRTED